MSEEILQRGLNISPEKIGTWDFYNIGATTIKALKNYGKIPNRDYKDFETRKPDGLIVDKKSVIAVVENKNISKFKTKKDKQKAISQGLEVAQALGAKIVIATDSVNTAWINALNGEEILDEKGREIKIVFDPKSLDIAKLIERIVDCVRVDNSQLIEPRLKDPTKLAKSVWQDLWSVSGATPENCLYTFVELFIFKYLSDLEVLKSRLSYQFLMGQFQEETEEEVLEYYANTIRKKVKELFPAGKDGTTIINGTIFVSKDDVAVKGYGTVFKKILVKFGDEREGGGELTNIDKDFKSKLFETFLKESISKKNLGQFFTPLKVVKAMVEMAKSEIKPGISICDPACGVGKFLLEPLIAGDNIEQFFEIKNGKLNTKIDLWGVDKGFDKDEQRTIILAKANMLIYLSDLIRKHSDITSQFAEFFNKSFELKNKNILGTLQDTKKDEFDLILANPPYVTSGSSNLKDEIAKNGDLQAYYKINGMGVEGLFMEWIIRALKPGGKAFIVVPDGVFNRQNDKNLRQFIIDECFIDGIISLPKKTFFTTPQKTYVLAISKKQNKSEIQKDSVFTYLVSEIGESRDIYRFNIDQNDLQKAVELFNAFKNSKDYFVKNNIDPRCKFQPFEKFVENLDQPNSWIIDKWWSEDEKISLGITTKQEKIDLIQFANLIEGSSDSLKGIQEEIKEILVKDNLNISIKQFKINQIFDLNIKTNNSKFTKSFIDQNKGNIPVYSASKFSDSPDYGYVKDNLPSIKYFEDCLTWNIDGSIGKVFHRKGRFSLSEKVIPLILKKEYIDKLDLAFLGSIIEKKFSTEGFNFSNKAGKGKIKDLEIDIPINSSGDLDLKTQKKIAEKYKFVDDMKKELKNQLDNLLNTEIKI